VNHLLKGFIRAREEAGQSMTEYALIMASVTIMAMLAYSSLGNTVSTLVNNVANKL
jgi:Flp pilus assembly pilin Flp